MSFGVGLSGWGIDFFAGALGAGEGTEEPPVVASKGLEIHIDGADFTGLVDLESVEVSTELNNRSEAEYTLIDKSIPEPSVRVKIGHEVQILLDDALIFGGYVEETTERASTDDDANFVEIQCVDFNSLADRHVVAATFDTPGQTLRDVVIDIVNVQSGDPGERLADDGVVVTPTSVQTGPVLGKIIATYQTVAELFDDLAELTGFWWTIGPSKILQFLDRQSFTAPFDLNVDTFGEYRNLVVQRSREDYRNIQILRAGRDVTEDRTERFTGDGETRSFTLSLPIAEEPTITVDPGSVSQTVGVKEVDDPAQWYYQIDDSTVTQEFADTPLTGSQILQVTYKGFYPIIDQGRNEGEIARLKSVSKNTGVDFDVEEDEKINDLDLAEQKTSALLRRFGRFPIELIYQTSRKGLAVGQLQQTNIPIHGVLGDALITKISFTFLGYEDNNQEVYRCRVSATDGEFLGGWAEFFKKLSTKGRPFVLRENEQLLLLRDLTDTISIGESVSTQKALGAFSDDEYSYFLIGSGKVGGRRQKSTDDTTEDISYGSRIGTPPKVAQS